LGDTIFVRSNFDDHSGYVDAGSVYVFTRSGGTWTEHQKLIASNPGSDHAFGWVVAASENTLIVGATGADAAYVFTRSGDTWTEHQILTGSDTAPGDGFGAWVSIDGDTLMVGATAHDHSGFSAAGAVYVFERTGDTWTEVQKLTASDPGSWDIFGGFVEVVGEIAVVSAFLDDHSGLTDAGSAYVFVRSGDVWVEQQKLTESDPGDHRLFGFAPMPVGDMVFVSAPSRYWPPTTQDAGSLYAFRRLNDTWVEVERATASDGEAGDSFGFGIRISGDFLVTGAVNDDHSGFIDAGSGYIYQLSVFSDSFESGDTSAWSSVVP
jgi:hypothetical protein